MQVAYIVRTAFTSRTRLGFDSDVAPSMATLAASLAMRLLTVGGVYKFIWCVSIGFCSKDKQNMEF